jgi:hypothetical protein
VEGGVAEEGAGGVAEGAQPGRVAADLGLGGLELEGDALLEAEAVGGLGGRGLRAGCRGWRRRGRAFGHGRRWSLSEKMEVRASSDDVGCLVGYNYGRVIDAFAELV